MNRIVNMQPGESLPPIQLDPVTRLDLIKYAGASGDYNPIHTIDEEAKNAGLPGIIAHGMWTMGNLAKLFTPYTEEGFIQDYSIRFSGMVFLDEVVTLQAELVEKSEGNLHFNVAAVNQQQKPVMTGQITFSTDGWVETA
ncbi:MaoC/PaaZ C-terminal domain-containing protein [Sporosarcina sp. 179-K 3D1 HS]|uniref:MaoC/PaaZ C-terminal domain-containing protein n=1 Tax=Sporosarcina sp. 179-K 3D1 HS TaxID=3232169 RepID=UPI0039A2898A